MTTSANEHPNDHGIAVRCQNVVHVFRTPGEEVAALRGVDLVVRDGEMVALLGPSGAGKTTLLWHLAGLLSPTAGTVEVAGQSMNGLNNQGLGKLRSTDIGIVMQNPSANLLPYATALGNLSFVANRSTSRKESKDRANGLLASVGLSAKANQPAGRFSGGEQQRLALAVALMNSPRLLLADEPTSQLDRVTGDVVLDLIATANADRGTTVVAVTHDPGVASRLGRTVTIRDGRVGAEGRGGEEYLVVGKDGTITLPPELLDVLPPGSLARPVRHADGVDLRRIE